MSVDQIRDRIREVLASADPAAQVHDYERWTDDPATVLEFLQSQAADDMSLCAWIFKPVAISEAPYTQQAHAATYIFLFRFVLTLVDADATEKRAWGNVERARTAMREHALLNNDTMSTTPDVGGLIGLAGLQVEKNEFIRIGGALAHYFELRMAVQELILIGS